jgi:hypothetical protein
MANPLGNLLQLLRLGDDEDYDDDYYEDDFEDDIDEEEERSLLAEEQRRQKRSERKSSRRSGYDEEEGESRQPAPEPRRTSVRTASNKVVPIRTTARRYASASRRILGIQRMRVRCFFRGVLLWSILKELTLWKHRGSWISSQDAFLQFPVKCTRSQDISLYSLRKMLTFPEIIWSFPEMMSLGFRH